MSKNSFWAIIIVLVFSNIYLLIHVEQGDNVNASAESIIKTSFEPNLIEKVFELENKIELETNTNFQLKDSPIKLVYFVPSKSCGTCVRYINNILNKNPNTLLDKISVISISDSTDSAFEAYPINKDYTHLSNIDRLFTDSDIDLSNPAFFWVYNNKIIIGAHITTIAQLHRTKSFLQKLSTVDF